MIRLRFIWIFVLTMILTSCNTNTDTPSASKVELKKNELGYHRLFVDGKEFVVQGAGLEYGNLEKLAECGANSFRNWRVNNSKETGLEVLDKAQKNNLMVLMCLDVARERHNFDYNDEVAVQKQFERIKGEVESLKDHPALLGWAIGNELNLRAENLKVYDAVNDISKLIHEIDPNHPTTTTLAGIKKEEIDYIKTHCADIDFLSIQMYGDIVNLQLRIEEAGWDGPYMITEWGATGHWEVQKTEWGAPIEQSSKEKFEAFIDRYNKAIISDPEDCLGSYVFLWGQKQERTPTWYGMFLDNGNITETVDAMQFLWTDKWPENRTPSLEAFTLNDKISYDNIKLKAEQDCYASVIVMDKENDPITYHWEIMHESTDHGHGGDHEQRPESLLSLNNDVSKIDFKVPVNAGAYRLFVYATDNGNRSATANIPFWVEE